MMPAQALVEITIEDVLQMAYQEIGRLRVENMVLQSRLAAAAAPTPDPGE